MIAVCRDGRLHFGAESSRAAVGRAGITHQKREGDGATPAGLLPLRQVFYRPDRIPRPKAAVRVEALSPQDGWSDDPADPAYNRFVTLPHAAHHEDLWRPDHLYDVIGVLGWNDAPPVPGRGSAIFLHLASPDGSPTEGCIAIALPDLLACLAAGLVAINVA